MLSWQIGRVTITRIVEMELVTRWREDRPFIVEATPAALEGTRWLYPHVVDDEGSLLVSIHALLVEAPGLRLVVDTCIGNDRNRAFLGGRSLSTPFLEHLEAAGWARESVEVVVCTHLHVDHVGWNTMLEAGKWVPTFPNARYLIGKREYDFWCAHDDEEQQAMLGDSVKPIVDAGLVQLVELDHVISPEIRLTPSIGHTPGHVSAMVESEGERAVITGDMTHHPCQMAHPDWSLGDNDPKAAALTRSRLFAEWADQTILVIGTHFPDPTAGQIVRDGAAFRLAV